MLCLFKNVLITEVLANIVLKIACETDEIKTILKQKPSKILRDLLHFPGKKLSTFPNSICKFYDFLVSLVFTPAKCRAPKFRVKIRKKSILENLKFAQFSSSRMQIIYQSEPSGKFATFREFSGYKLLIKIDQKSVKMIFRIPRFLWGKKSCLNFLQFFVDFCCCDRKNVGNFENLSKDKIINFENILSASPQPCRE